MQKANKPGEESNEDSGENGTSTESESGDDNKATCYAFTYAALQEMDDTNMKEWKTHQKIQRLMGVAGVQRAARAILRQEREGRHKKTTSPNVIADSLHLTKRVKCNVPGHDDMYLEHQKQRQNCLLVHSTVCSHRHQAGLCGLPGTSTHNCKLKANAPHVQRSSTATSKHAGSS